VDVPTLQTRPAWQVVALGALGTLIVVAVLALVLGAWEGHQAYVFLSTARPAPVTQPTAAKTP
jgi:hypothetical protein